MPPRFHHVANGHATTQLIEAAHLPGPTDVWCDVLHEGPVPGDQSDEELVRTRARYLTSDAFNWGGHTFDELASELSHLRTVVDAVHDRDELVLWYEHDLFDQLNLIQILSRLLETGAVAHPVSLVSIGSFPGREHFKGLGELTPADIASLFEQRVRVTRAQCVLATHAWHAFRATDPRQIEAVLRMDTTALPYLAGALRRHLEEFPSTNGGLSRTERHLLELALSGSITIWDAFSRIHDGETAFYIADASFWTVVEGLAAGSRPLLAIAIATRERGRLPSGSLAMTDSGRAILGGHADRVRLTGIDRWLGGVHLSGADAMWRWNRDAARIDIA